MGNLVSTDKVVTENDLKDFYDGIRPFLNGSYPTLASPFALSELYSTSEKLIGQWIDGKPLYQKTISGNLPSSTGYVSIGKISTLIGTGVNIVEFKGICDWYQSANSYGIVPFNLTAGDSISAINNTVSVFTNESSGDIFVWLQGEHFKGKPYKLTVQYTKTTDSATQNFSTPSNYSTSETVVGTWIDGKPIYQKTVSFPAGTLPNATAGTYTYTQVSYTNKLPSTMQNLLGFEGTYKDSNNLIAAFPLHNGYFDMDLYLDLTNQKIVFCTSGNLSLVATAITFRYTKTTD